MSLYDDSMTALKLRIKDLTDQKNVLVGQVKETNNLLKPLNDRLKDKQSQLDAVNSSIDNLSANVNRLQVIIDLDNEAAAKGLPLPSEQP